tara:strand:- start:378 stop:500 length:123 start_codon:yes stop_codon:yes gene_type:complete
LKAGKTDKVSLENALKAGYTKADFAHDREKGFVGMSETRS